MSNGERMIPDEAKLLQLDASRLLDRLAPCFPLIGQMSATPQDPEWHAEGDVRVHTCLVIDETRKILDTHPEAQGLDAAERCALVLGAALHDIGKCLTTREQIIDGKDRITSPRHADRGRSYVAPRIPQLQLPERIYDLVLMIVGHHHDPRKLLARSASGSARRFRRFARIANARLIYLFELADNLGRINRNGSGEAIETTELFRLACHEHGIWDNAFPYRDWHAVIQEQLRDEPRDVVDYVVGEAVRWHEAGEISTPHEALARSFEHRRDSGQLILTCGASGSGKSSWVSEQLPDHQKICLDDLREQMSGGRNSRKREGRVLQEARERLRCCLRGKQKVVWDATNLRKDRRDDLLQLANRYRSRTAIVAFATPPAELHRRNRKRTDSVPSTVIDRQLQQLEWPYAWQAHQLDVIYHARPDGT